MQRDDAGQFDAAARILFTILENARSFALRGVLLRRHEGRRPAVG